MLPFCPEKVVFSSYYKKETKEVIIFGNNLLNRKTKKGLLIAEEC